MYTGGLGDDYRKSTGTEQEKAPGYKMATFFVMFFHHIENAERIFLDIVAIFICLAERCGLGCDSRGKRRLNFFSYAFEA